MLTPDDPFTENPEEHVADLAPITEVAAGLPSKGAPQHVDAAKGLNIFENRQDNQDFASHDPQTELLTNASQPASGVPVPASLPSTSSHSPNASVNTFTVDRSQSPVTMRVESTFRGNETVRSITYFLICTNTRENIVVPPEISVPDLKLTPPHLRCINPDLAIVQWAAGKEAMVQRRYSEACLLRELLQFQFPHLLIPPLRLKSATENLESFTNSDQLNLELTFQLQYFLYHLTRIPQIIFLSSMVQSFALDSRDEFERSTLPRMKEKVNAFRRANKAVEDFSGQQKEFTTTVTSALVNASTKTLRSVIGFFNNNPPTCVVGSDAAEVVSTETPQTSTEAPCGEAFDDVSEWSRIAGDLTVRRKHLKEAAAAFNVFLSRLNQISTARINMSQAAHGIAQELMAHQGSPDKAENTPPFLSAGFNGLGESLRETVEIERSARKQQFADVCSRLRCEADYIKAILYKIDDILSLFAYQEKSKVYERNSPMWKDSMECTQFISNSVRREYDNVYLPQFHQRMNELKERAFRPMACSAVQQGNYLEKSSLEAFIQQLPASVVAAAGGA